MDTLEPTASVGGKRRGRPRNKPVDGGARPALSQAMRDELAACIEQLQSTLRTRISQMDSQSRVEAIHQEQRGIVASVIARLSALA